MNRQRGGALIVTLVAMTVLVVGAMSLLRSTNTASDIVGNTTSKQAAVEAADTAFQAAAVRLSTLTAIDTNIAGVYYALQQTVDANGLIVADWSTVPITQVGNFKVQYLMDRLCDAPLPVTDNMAQCSVAPANGQAISHKVGAPIFLPKPPVYYRVTARIAGPKSSESYLQAVLSK